MAKFIKPFDDTVKEVTPSGYTYEKVYTQRYDKEGRPFLEQIGTKNIVEMINSNKDKADYDKLIRKFQATGDISFLNGKEGFYADMSEVPNSLIDAYNTIQDSRMIFDQLPKDQREKYNNSFTEFIADFGSEKWLEAFGIPKKVEQSEVIEENAAE